MIGTKPIQFNSLIFNPFQPNKFLIHSIMDNRGNQLKNIGNYVILGSIALVILLDLGNRDGGALIFLLLLIVGFLCVLAGEAVTNPFEIRDDTTVEDVGSFAMEQQDSSSSAEESGSFYREDEDSGGLY